MLVKTESPRKLFNISIKCDCTRPNYLTVSLLHDIQRFWRHLITWHKSRDIWKQEVIYLFQWILTHVLLKHFCSCRPLLRKLSKNWLFTDIPTQVHTPLLLPGRAAIRSSVHVSPPSGITHAPAPHGRAKPHSSSPCFTTHALDEQYWGRHWGAKPTARLGNLPHPGTLQGHLHLFWTRF